MNVKNYKAYRNSKEKASCKENKDLSSVPNPEEQKNLNHIFGFVNKHKKILTHSDGTVKFKMTVGFDWKLKQRSVKLETQYKYGFVDSYTTELSRGQIVKLCRKNGLEVIEDFYDFTVIVK